MFDNKRPKGGLNATQIIFGRKNKRHHQKRKQLSNDLQSNFGRTKTGDPKFTYESQSLEMNSLFQTVNHNDY